jgi:hypothetical protein
MAAATVPVLPGCIAMLVVAGSLGPSPKEDFEAHANGRVYAPYLDACYWRRQYDPERSLCGRLTDTREMPQVIEYVHAPYGQCVYSFVVDKDTQLITSWRYVSAPESCWAQPSSG